MRNRRNVLVIIILLFSSLQLFAQAKPTASQWQADLKFLQETVNRNYQPLFRKISQPEFNAAVERLHQQIPTMERHEVIVGLAEIVALFKYGHTVLPLRSWIHDPRIDFQQLPLNFYWFKDGIFLQGTHKDYQQALGAKVLRVGDTPIEKALAAIKLVVSSENDQFFKGYGLRYLGVPQILHAKGVIEDPEQVTLHLEKDGKQFSIDIQPINATHFPGRYGLFQTYSDWLAARSYETTPHWLRYLEKKYYYEYLPDKKAVYVRQSEVINDEENIANFYQRTFDFIEKNDVEKLIIDLRLNGGGNNYNNRAVIKQLIKSEKIDQPNRLYVILGRNTFSAAQNFVNEIENYTNVIFVGEPTAENVNFFGDVNTVTLPNSKLNIFLSHAWWQDKDPRDTRQWTAPHWPAELTFEDYATNKDPVLEMIFLGADLENKVTTLLHSGNITKIRDTMQAYLDAPVYDFYNFQVKINSVGYQLINENRNKDALDLFKMNTELFPENVNGWDSLAEGYWRNGDIDSAKKYYNKVITMAPNSRVAENSRNMLARIGG